MDWKGGLYKVAMAAWIVLVLGAWFSIAEGYTEPWLAISDFPGGSEGAFAATIGAVIAGLVVIGFLRRRHVVNQWTAAGRQANLRPVGDGSYKGAPELTGTVDGRTVTARYDKRREKDHRGRKMSDGGDMITYTTVEAELSGPADGGVIAFPADQRDGNHGGTGTLEIGDDPETASAEDGVVTVATDGLLLTGTPPTAVEAVGDGLSGRALRAIRDLQVAAVGDASGLATEATGTGVGSSMMGLGLNVFNDQFPNDETAVTVETKASVRDGDELRRLCEGVVAVADAFEEATSRTSVPE
jgi:hypothetical protein